MAAWCVLASFGGGALMAIEAIAGGIAYGVLVLTVGRRVLARLGAAAERAGKLTPTIVRGRWSGENRRRATRP